MIEALLFPHMCYKDKIPLEKISGLKEIIEKSITMILNDLEKHRLNEIFIAVFDK